VKYRFLMNAIIFVFSLPTAGFGAAISTAFIIHTNAGWRWVYYLLIILNGVTALLYAVFYFPPTFHQKHGRDTVTSWLKHFDYGGLLLYTAGLVLFILGLSSGGSLYPWTDAKVIAPLVVGFLCLVALFFYETFMDLKEPLIPMHLFKNRGWVASMLSLSIGASVYYSQAIIWPQMTANVYAKGRVEWSGIVSCLVGVGITLGEIIGGGLAKVRELVLFLPREANDSLEFRSLEDPVLLRNHSRYPFPWTWSSLHTKHTRHGNGFRAHSHHLHRLERSAGVSHLHDRDSRPGGDRYRSWYCRLGQIRHLHSGIDCLLGRPYCARY
jgi:hypothetical protein